MSLVVRIAVRSERSLRFDLIPGSASAIRAGIKMFSALKTILMPSWDEFAADAKATPQEGLI